MILPVGIRVYESGDSGDGSIVRVTALYLRYVGGLAFYARDGFPYFGVQPFGRDGGFTVHDDIARYE